MRSEQTNANEHLRCLVFTFCTCTTGAVLVAGAALESAAAVEAGVAAVATAARHARPEPGQYRCAYLSSINPLKIATRTAAA